MIFYTVVIQWLERLTANANSLAMLGLTLASSDTV